jgi:hypothetical protein
MTSFKFDENIKEVYIKIHYPSTNLKWLPIPVAARSNAWVFGRSLAGTVGSNQAGGMDVCLL